MRLWALMIFYNEPVSWLAATTASLSKLGVHHFIAVDGAFVQYDNKPRSGLEQATAIMDAGEAVGMGTTVVRPSTVFRSEVEKRALTFRLLEAMATPYEDWFTIIDADEIILEGSPMFREGLAGLSDDFHCAAIKWHEALDPYATEGRNVSEKTPEMHHKIPLAPEHYGLQSRFWRVMRNMDVQHNHYGFVGDDADGVRWNIRPDIGTRHVAGLRKTQVATQGDLHGYELPVIEHRDAWRTALKREQKAAYYQLRDTTGIEAIPDHLAEPV